MLDDAKIEKSAQMEYAAKYISAGFRPIPVLYKGKRPALADWTNACVGHENVDEFFPVGVDSNIGILLGEASVNLVDVDLDTAAAVALAAQWLPKTGMKFGPESASPSHFIYRSRIDRTRQFEHPETGEMIVELRGSGLQTVFPGSVNDRGESIVFAAPECLEPSEVDGPELLKSVAWLAVGAVVSDHWRRGSRHKLALALAGCAYSGGLEQEQASRLVEGIASSNRDDDLKDRLECVHTTYARAPGQPIACWAALADIVSPRAVERFRQWVGKRQLDVVGGRELITIDPTAYSPIQDMRTDAESARVFADNFCERLIYDDESRQWFSRENDVYLKISGEAVQGMVSEFALSVVRHSRSVDTQVARKILSSASIKSTQELARARLIVPSSKFDTDELLAGSQNGVVDLRLGRLVNPTSIVTKRLGAVFDPEAECPQWKSFISSIFADDRDKMAFVQRAVGYTLTGSTAEQCLFILTGAGANGKSTFLKAISAMMGDYATSTPMQTLMVSKYGSEKTDDLAALRGRRLVCASEGELGQKLAEAKIKAITGGDPIACRPLYGNLFTYQPQFKLWLATNDLPKISGTDEAIWRRINVVEFPVTFAPDERDQHLYQKLRAELPGILNWALDGCAAWQDEGLNAPASVKDATGSFRSENDTVGRFVESACERKAGTRTLNSALFKCYRDWCENNSCEAVTAGQFGKELTRLGFESYKTKFGNGRCGIELLSSSTSESEAFISSTELRVKGTP
jgi:putative DNA primase/helicase